MDQRTDAGLHRVQRHRLEPSVAEIDAQLYAKYRLSDDEIKFIESMIKPM